MSFHVLNYLLAITVYVLLCLLMFGCFAFGRKLGQRHLATEPNGRLAIVRLAEGTIFALLGLMIAFTFYGASDRFEKRKERIIDEYNALENSYMRLDLLPPTDPRALAIRTALIAYVDTRIDTYRIHSKLSEILRPSHQTIVVRNKIWQALIAACEAKGDTATTMLLVSKFTELFDIANTRHLYSRIHPPLPIFFLLVALAAVASIIAGFSMAKSKKTFTFYTSSFVLITAFTMYVTFDLEFPRMGIMRVDRFDPLLMDIRDEMLADLSSRQQQQ